MLHFEKARVLLHACFFICPIVLRISGGRRFGLPDDNGDVIGSEAHSEPLLEPNSCVVGEGV